MIGVDSLPPWQLALLVPGIAFLYASVGFGGASGYLAAMSLFLIAPELMASTALLLNLVVSSIAFITYYRARHFTPRLLWPFLVTSIPAAFVGGSLKIDVGTYLFLLYLTLSYVAIWLLIAQPITAAQIERRRSFPFLLASACGAGIGLLSGIIGIGGGILLSPLIVLAGWGAPKQAAASAAGFIFINSASGLLGRMGSGNFQFGLLGITLLPLGLLGALGGSQLGSRVLTGQSVRRLLGVVLLIAAGRFWFSYLR